MIDMPANSTSHPAFSGFREVILLSGFSGATIALVRGSDGAPFVRKAANTADTNDRLRTQAYRQTSLAEVIKGCADLPEVLRDGLTEGLYYFDMQFVPSRDAVNYLSNTSFENVAEFAVRIEQLMYRLAEAPALTTTPIKPERSVLLEKLNQIAARTKDLNERDLAPLFRAARQMDTFVADPSATASHGDLTFENILVGRRGDLWLIDTIESPFDHYWIDWSKLFQECEGRWHAHRGRPIATGVTWWLRNHFLAAATRQNPFYPARHYILLGLTFARILPYAHSEADRAFVANRVLNCGHAALQLLDQG
jgi:hypothetical protein